MLGGHRLLGPGPAAVGVAGSLQSLLLGSSTLGRLHASGASLRCLFQRNMVAGWMAVCLIQQQAAGALPIHRPNNACGRRGRVTLSAPLTAAAARDDLI